MKGAKDFFNECLWRPVAILWVVLPGLVTLLGFWGVEESWSSSVKALLVTVVTLATLLIYVLWVAYSYYAASTEVRPLRVRRVLPGTHYFEGEMIVVLEPRETISIGDVLTLYVREADVETPICLLSVEILNTDGFLQSRVFLPLTNTPLTSYLKDESRHEQLTAKPSVTRRHLEEGGPG